MADATIVKKLSDLKELFGQMKEVYLVDKANTKLSALSKFDMEIPVLDDGVSFDTGTPDITKIKLTTGATWTAVSNAGDSNISFQVPSVSDEVASRLMTKKSDAEVAVSATINGYDYKGLGYNFEPKKLECGLFLCSEDKASAIFLPNVEGYSNFVIEDGKPAYFNVAITPLNDEDGISFYILKGTKHTGA